MVPSIGLLSEDGMEGPREEAHPNVTLVIGADGTCLLRFVESTLYDYLEGLQDGLCGTPFVRSRRIDGSP